MLRRDVTVQLVMYVIQHRAKFKILQFYNFKEKQTITKSNFDAADTQFYPRTHVEAVYIR